MIKAENVKKVFGSTTVLESVDLAVNPGEVVSILGASGSGKSTLIRCINGLEKLDGLRRGHGRGHVFAPCAAPKDHKQGDNDALQGWRQHNRPSRAQWTTGK